MQSYSILRVGVDESVAPYLMRLANFCLFIGQCPGKYRREFRLRPVCIAKDPGLYRDELRFARCHFYLSAYAASRRRVEVHVSRLTYASNGPGRTWKLYLGRGGRLGIRHAAAELKSRGLPPLHEVTGAMRDLLEAMGRELQNKWLATIQQVR